MAIGEVASTLGITLRALRFYEQKGLIQPIRRGAWTRTYRHQDVERLRLIARLRAAGVPIIDIKAVLDRASVSDNGVVAWTAVLHQRLESIAAERARLDAEEKMVRDMLAAAEVAA
jgi:putative AdoMet-dependent methyltransferase